MRTSLVGVLSLLLAAPLSSATAIPHHDNSPLTKRAKAAVSIDDLYTTLNKEPRESYIQAFTRYYASGPHLAGKNYSQAVWTQQKLQEYGVDAEIVSYDVYLNYPIRTRLALLRKDSQTTNGHKVVYEAQLQEDVLEEDPTTGHPDRIPSFHGYSASGNVTGQLVFANYGRVEDYRFLTEQGISLKDKIVIVKYGKVFRGLKVEKAQELGAIGVVMYSDPGDDANTTEAKGVKPYPHGPARQPSSVQKGSVEFLSTGVGDPTTPGYASKPGVKREDPYKLMPRIPSLPLSYMDAIPFLKALEGHGLDTSKMSDEAWKTGGLGYKGVKYFTGPSNSSMVVNLLNEQEYVTTPIWDVIGTIPGQLKDELVMIGNHRDSWSVGGAIDPNGASACLIELARVLKVMRDKGWTPRRTLMLASWDAEEYGIIGSTEWVEEFAGNINQKMVAYINMDGAPLGPNMYVMAHPLLTSAITAASKRVKNYETGLPIYDTWDQEIGPIGSGSDFTAFQGTIGIPSMDFTLEPDYRKDNPIYHYHSNYDSIAWAEKYADPGYFFHAQALKMWGALLLEVSESPVISFKASDYAASLIDIVNSLSSTLGKASDNSASARSFQTSMEALKTTVKTFSENAKRLDKASETIMKQFTKNDVVADKYQTAATTLNSALLGLDRRFIYQPGLDNRTFYKHVINAPNRNDGYYTVLMPGLVESIEDKNWPNGNRWAGIIGDCTVNATRLLQSAITAVEALGI
ncbi:putative vacuolar protein sorting-associated protein [Ascobolus immersus RN42]|uniref:Putative vacuolar protein sorting-associated protein n=1 Tax=Ascobolus immersus RN42 TaxID=1160509 RepID=A0A3N4I7X9_ASCIM|nr:putative vacuolar protein sorting-associated protein [Ascobolus immersus RN42]